KKRGQEELDTVVGDRLPTLKDRDSLPYINAICEEVLRWPCPVLPIGLPHATTPDDTYGELFISKGNIIHHNTWCALNHPTCGTRTTKSKYVLENGWKVTAGFSPGYTEPNVGILLLRICPGRFLAIKTLYLMVSSVLKTFDISHTKDSNGSVIPVDPDAYYSRIVS
ncbi:hypothetical protein M422DRAFT_155047, partial [Sphaerobolus stellatus SS14]